MSDGSQRQQPESAEVQDIRETEDGKKNNQEDCISDYSLAKYPVLTSCLGYMTQSLKWIVKQHCNVPAVEIRHKL